MSSLLRLDNWQDTVFLNDFLKVGDEIDKEFYNYLLNNTQPQTNWQYLFQMGEPVEHIRKPDGTVRPTFMTFEKCDDSGGWKYVGECFDKEKVNQNSKCDITVVARFEEEVDAEQPAYTGLKDFNKTHHLIIKNENGFDNYYSFDYSNNIGNAGQTQAHFETMDEAMRVMKQHRPNAFLINYNFGELVRSAIGSLDEYKSEKELLNKSKEEMLADILKQAHEDFEIDTVCDVLTACKLDDIDIAFEGDTIVASDKDGNKWKGAELYQFLVNDVLCYGADGKLVKGFGLDEQLADNLLECAKEYGVEPINVAKQNEPIIEQNEPDICDD